MARAVQFSKYQIPEKEIEVTWARSGGPGGQNVNKVASKAVVRFRPASSSLPPEVRARILDKLAGLLTTNGEIIITASEYRDAPRNLEAALVRLEVMLTKAMFTPKARKKTRPTRGSAEQRLTTKKKRGDVKRERRRGVED